MFLLLLARKLEIFSITTYNIDKKKEAAWNGVLIAEVTMFQDEKIDNVTL
ncbi:hypothetical protein [Patiriisocius marinus]|nr:hypothetical protein [Patiriisocius marinus]